MRLAFLLPWLLACGGAQLQTVSLVNQTDRTIKELYVFPAGSKDKGPSRATLAPAAGTKVQIKAGNVEVYAVSETVKLDDHHRDTPTASQSLELRGPLEVIFYDSNSKPAGVDKPNVIGVSFIVADKPKPAAPDPAPGE